MKANKIIEIVDNLKQQGTMNFIEGATAEQVEQFEKENNVYLPQMFKEWLMFSDGGECFLPGGIQLYGIAHKPLIDILDNDRPDDTYVVIGATSWGDPIIYKKGEEKISLYNHAEGKIEEDESYEDFSAFLNDLNAMLNGEED